MSESQTVVVETKVVTVASTSDGPKKKMDELKAQNAFHYDVIDTVGALWKAISDHMRNGYLPKTKTL